MFTLLLEKADKYASYYKYLQKTCVKLNGSRLIIMLYLQLVRFSVGELMLI